MAIFNVVKVWKYRELLTVEAETHEEAEAIALMEDGEKEDEYLSDIKINRVFED